jgi:hypothetical protein
MTNGLNYRTKLVIYVLILLKSVAFKKLVLYNE